METKSPGLFLSAAFIAQEELNRRCAPGAEKVEKEVTIVNRHGLHARPAAMLVRVASRFRCDVWVAKDGKEINGQSILGLVMLAVGHGSTLRIRAEGPDATAAMREIEQLIQSGFDEG